MIWDFRTVFLLKRYGHTSFKNFNTSTMDLSFPLKFRVAKNSRRVEIFPNYVKFQARTQAFCQGGTAHGRRDAIVNR